MNKTLLERVFKIRPAERHLAITVASVFFGTQVTHALSANTADTLFFSRFGVDNLPQMFIIVGVVAGLVLVAYTAGLGRASRHIFYPGLLGGGAILMVVLRLLVIPGNRFVYPVIWVTSNTLLLVTLTFMWNIAGDVVDARSAKRLFPFFASAGILGGVLGNLATGPLTSLMGAPNLLLVVAVILVGVSFPTRSVARGIKAQPTGHALIGDVAEALRIGWTSPLLRLVAVALTLASVLFPLVVFPFSVEVADTFVTEERIAGFLGFFSAAATGATFLISLFAVNRLFARLGVVVTWFLVGVVYLGGFTLWVFTLTLATAAVFRSLQWIAVNAIGGTARSALFNVLRSDRRGAVIAAYAAVPQQIGSVIAGILLWVTLGADPRLAAFVGLVVAATFAGLIWAMRKRYTKSLVTALRTANLDAFAGPFSAVGGLPATGEAIAVARTGLQSDAPAERSLAVATLGHMGAIAETDAVVAALGDEHLDVRVAALDTLNRLAAAPGGSATAPSRDIVLGALFPEMGFAGGLEGAPLRLKSRACEWLIAIGEHDSAAAVLDQMVHADEPDRRRAALLVMANKGWTPQQDWVTGALQNDSSDAVRAAACAALAATSGPTVELAAAITDPAVRVRVAAAEAWASSGGGPERPFEVLREGPTWAWEQAIMALRNQASVVRDDVFEWAKPRVQDLVDLASQYAALLAIESDSVSMPATAYLTWIAEQTVQASQRVAIRILALIEDEETARLVIGGIRSTDPDSRAQALEVAESLGGELGRIVVPALEAVALPPSDVSQVLRLWVASESPWNRALALRAVAELAAREWSDVVRPAVNDAHPVVREVARDVLGRMGADMTESIDGLGIMDRVLALRRVSLFAELAPEDLERLAQLAQEDRYADGETILEQGENGDRVINIIEGEVEVRPHGAPPLARLGPGEYVGELTALSGGTRAASVYASGPVWALSIDSNVLSNLILDRPEVARQMLTVLSQRLADAVAGLQTGASE